MAITVCLTEALFGGGYPLVISVRIRHPAEFHRAVEQTAGRTGQKRRFVNLMEPQASSAGGD